MAVFVPHVFRVYEISNDAGPVAVDQMFDFDRYRVGEFAIVVDGKLHGRMLWMETTSLADALDWCDLNAEDIPNGL